MSLAAPSPPHRALLVALLITATDAHRPLQAQTTPPATNATVFEVASVKPNNVGGHTSFTISGGRLTVTNFSLTMLMQYAFGIREFQISGGPGWLTTERYDIVATTGAQDGLTSKELEPYLQSLLRDRFQLKVHRETKVFQVYSLVLAKNGPKLTAHTGAGESSIIGRDESGRISKNATNATTARLANTLSAELDRTVIDNTGLKGGYDFHLEWAPNPTPDSDEPSLFTAVQQQLGLKLESARSPVEIIVIDSAEKPSAN
jgi:uncharacterized protein (TIGR03435 family)